MVEKNNTTFLLAKSSLDEPSLHRSELLPAKRQVGVCLKGRGESAPGGGGWGVSCPRSSPSIVTDELGDQDPVPDKKHPTGLHGVCQSVAAHKN